LRGWKSRLTSDRSLASRVRRAVFLRFASGAIESMQSIAIPRREEEDYTPMAKTKAAKAPTKTEIFTAIAEETQLTRKQVASVFTALAGQIERSVGKRGPGVFAIPGLVKIEKKDVPARPARKNVPNPFRPGETMNVAARKASKKIKVRALKSLKDMI
jgi:nucleoid DNA-binding protein